MTEQRRIVHPRFLDATNEVTRAVKQLQAFDPTLDVLWNGRIGRWVVVQKLNKWMPVTEKLRGISTIAGERTQYKTMFVCELDPPDSRPVTPGSWIIRRICEVAPMSQEERRIAGDEKAQEEAEERELRRILDDLSGNMRRDLRVYGGIGKNADPFGCDLRGKRHFVFHG